MEIQICPECNTRPLKANSEDFICLVCRAERDNLKPPRPAHVYSVRVETYDENVAPPDHLVDLALVHGVFFIDLIDYNEERLSSETSTRSAVGIEFEALNRAFKAFGLKIVKDD